MASYLGRRKFLATLGGATLGGAAAAWPLAARAQQPTGQPLVGLLSPLSATAWVHIVGAFRRPARDCRPAEDRPFFWVFHDGLPLEFGMHLIDDRRREIRRLLEQR
jgi:hypothetical protein